MRWLLPAAALHILGLLAYGLVLDPRNIPSPLGVAGVASPRYPFDAFAAHARDAARRVVVRQLLCLGCTPACYDEARLERAWQPTETAAWWWAST